jgi:hypothetical protein
MNKRQPATQKRGAPPLTGSEPPFVPDLDRQLRYFQKMATMHGPFFTWRAIRECIEHEKSFPTWVMDYLRQCADRMISDRTDNKAKRARSGKAKDPRDRLLEIFDFPKQKKPGPGSPLDPRDAWRKALKKHLFAVEFAQELKKGETPAKARRNAGDKVFRKDGDEGKEIDDRTLRKYLEEKFGSLPTTKQEWEPVIAQYFNDCRLVIVPINPSELA